MLWLGVSLISSADTHNSAEPIKIVAGQYRGVLDSPTSGVLAEIHQLITAETGLSVNLDISPARRARHLFYSGEAVGSFAVFNAVKRPMRIIYSVPFLTLNRYLITAQGQPALRKLSELKGLRVGLVQGYIYNRLDMDLLADQGTTIHWSHDQEANLRMLSAGRVDAVIATPIECVMLAKQSRLPRPVYDLESPITQYEFVYAFHETDQGHTLQATFSAAIQRLEARNELQPLADQFKTTMNQSD